MKITRIVTVIKRYKFSMNGNDKCSVCYRYLRVAMVFVGFITRVTVVILYHVYYLDLDLCCTQQLCTGVNVINLPGHGQ